MVLRETGERALADLFFTIRDKNGWLADCKAAGFSDYELDYLEQMAIEFADYDPRAEAAEWAKLVEKDGGADVYFASSDDERIRILSNRIGEIYGDYERSMFADDPYVDRLVGLKVSRVDHLERLRRSIRGRQIHKEPKGASSDRVTDQDIERARSYPLEKLIPDFDIARGGYILCRWHESTRPHMLIKNGWGFCFVCEKSIDSIGWMMDVEKLSFFDAVRKLIGRG